MATSFPEDVARADIENTSVSRGFACACTRNVQCRCFAAASTSAKARQNTNTQRSLMPIDCEDIREFINGLTAILQPRKVFGLFGPHEAPPCFARSDSFCGWGHGRPGRYAHAHTKTRLVEPDSSSVFSQRRSAIQRSTAAWARP